MLTGPTRVVILLCGLLAAGPAFAQGAPLSLTPS
jgi:hypothetical protein